MAALGRQGILLGGQPGLGGAGPAGLPQGKKPQAHRSQNGREGEERQNRDVSHFPTTIGGKVKCP